MDDFTFNGEEVCGEELWESFLQHACWVEFIDTIKARLSIVRTELEVGVDRDEMLRLQGEARNLRFIMNFGTLVQQEAASKNKSKEDEDGR